ncbi:MAG TPA: hypothetical protein VKF40_00480 [Burkholderiales bacterium]|nr:hypothetical protein [Burkholderiales bacterium]
MSKLLSVLVAAVFAAVAVTPVAFAQDKKDEAPKKEMKKGDDAKKSEGKKGEPTDAGKKEMKKGDDKKKADDKK